MKKATVVAAIGAAVAGYGRSDDPEAASAGTTTQGSGKPVDVAED